ncbi:MAG: amidophosphoribosyltransferase [Muribaculaceae bacterium]|nr:amidophosphoribosyltransferase [Muribaculaceae bacterium]
MEQLKHECGIAMIKLRKPLQYYKEKYGTYLYGLNKLYLLMEKQHNRGQEGAGIGCVYTHSKPGEEYIFRDRALGSGAISEIFDRVRKDIHEALVQGVAPIDLPFVGELYMGHLRYSTTGKNGLSFVHPFLRRNNWKSRNLLLCGNFNMTNVDEIFGDIVSRGQHPRVKSDTILLLEQLGESLDNENQRLHRIYREQGLTGTELTEAMESNLDFKRILERPSSTWDGGYAMCGITGSGDMFVMRDPHGIRPAFYYIDDEIFVAASERPVIQTVMNVPVDAIHELTPGAAITVSKNNDISIEQILPQLDYRHCSFERIYFSRGSDRDIYNERKALGHNIAPQVINAVNGDLDNTIVSFIPNTAEVAYMGLVEGLEQHLQHDKLQRIKALDHDAPDYDAALEAILSHRLRTEKIAIKDIKLRTFITEGNQRNDLAAHVYDVTYGQVRNGIDNLVVIDDSIVRGTTLKQSILRILDRLHPRKIVIVSSAPQIRYPDYYGIDMSRMSEFCAFKAAIQLLKDTGQQSVIDDVYAKCKAQEGLPKEQIKNYVTEIYAPFTDEDISRQIVVMLKDKDIQADVELVFQTVDGLHQAIPTAPGDWYFSGNYPTPGGNMMVNKAFINWYEGNPLKR